MPPEQLRKINRILTALDAVSLESDIMKIRMGIHPLKGGLKGKWAVSVSANYRIIFGFVAPNIIEVDYIDYH